MPFNPFDPGTLDGSPIQTRKLKSKVTSKRRDASAFYSGVQDATEVEPTDKTSTVGGRAPTLNPSGLQIVN